MGKLYKNKLAVLLIGMVLILGFVLPGCTSQEAAPPAQEVAPPAQEVAPPAQEAAPPARELSFGAAEYANADYGFSIKYPNDWIEKPGKVAEIQTTIFWAEAKETVPILAFDVLDAEEGVNFVDAATAMLAGGGSELIEFLSDSETTLTGGTPAFDGVVKFVAEGFPCKALCVGVAKDNQWIFLTITTAYTFVPYDEALYSEIASTWQFK